jgi:hypothetical protein
MAIISMTDGGKRIGVAARLREGAALHFFDGDAHGIGERLIASVPWRFAAPRSAARRADECTKHAAKSTSANRATTLPMPGALRIARSTNRRQTASEMRWRDRSNRAR